MSAYNVGYRTRCCGNEYVNEVCVASYLVYDVAVKGDLTPPTGVNLKCSSYQEKLSVLCDLKISSRVGVTASSATCPTCAHSNDTIEERLARYGLGSIQQWPLRSNWKCGTAFPKPSSILRPLVPSACCASLPHGYNRGMVMTIRRNRECMEALANIWTLI